MVGIEAGDELEFDHIGDGTLRVRKASHYEPGRGGSRQAPR